MPPSLDSSEIKLIIIKAETPLECIRPKLLDLAKTRRIQIRLPL